MQIQKKICVVGAGKWGINHIRTLNELGALGAVVDQDSDLLDTIKELYPFCDVFNDLSDALQMGFDGYVIATPPSSHYSLGKKVIKARKPVLIEKPFTLDYASAKKLNDLAKKEDVNIMVGHVLLFHPAFNKMKEIIDAGTIGNIQYLYSNRLNLGTFRSDENVFWSFAPHDISLFNYFLGQSPSSISSQGVDILQKNIHDITLATFKYSENRMGHIFVSWLHPFKEHRFIIVGSKGMLSFEDSVTSKPLVLYDKKAEFVNSMPNEKIGENQNIAYDNTSPLKNELEYFISNIDSNDFNIASGDSAAEVIKILEKASESLTEF